MSVVLTYSAIPVGLLVLTAVAERAVAIVEGYLANRTTGKEIDARMNVPLAAARAELADPATPYIAPVLGVRIGTRHPEPVEHLTPAPVAYAGRHRLGEESVTAEFHRIVSVEFPAPLASYVESAT